MTGQWKSIVQRRILGVGKRVSCPKNGWTDVNNLCTFLHMELAFEGRSDCTSIEIFSGVNFLIAVNS